VTSACRSSPHARLRDVIKAVRSRRTEGAVALQLGESARLDEHRSIGARGVSPERSRVPATAPGPQTRVGGGVWALNPPGAFSVAREANVSDPWIVARSPPSLGEVR